ncbi:calcium-binding protein [Micromonospora sp. C28SCA-DRY-2]|uniref:calcium-binding protein n=1 Tax=Micromonospora sp. C28SCA-DRY-2 TaxID=3059522 RepID=UPI00267576FD|nr:calcium-binding protein [Micromonospora sp. C28SCA-DRY-2]MDO3702850.1 calcium-binding protein [Micromonospora sp. C28SCA-DRY-2]
MALRRLLAAAVATLLATTFALVVTAPPAQADEAWETALKGLMDRTATWTEGGLSRIGALAQPLPLLGVSPGSLVQADTLARTAADALADDLERDVDLGGGTRLTSTVTSSGGDHLLDVLLATKREVTEQDLAVSGVTVADAVSVTGWATLHLRARHTAAGETYLVRDGDSPRIDIDAVARFRSDLDQADAAVGILGVTLTAGSTLTASSHLKVTLTDPNGDGRLAFDTPSGAGTGELGAAGSLAGLAQVALDGSGGGRISDTETEAGPGSVHGVVKLGAATAGTPFDLPAIAATVTIDWADIAVGSPTVTTSGLDETIGRFRTMSPLDLAAGIAQLATLIGGVQQSGPAGNLDLPFLRGTFADAVKVNEKLTDFLREHVHPRPEDPHFQPGVDDPARAGQPKFTSIQELLALLAAEGMPVDGLSFADDKLVFRVKLERESTVEVPLDPGAPQVSGRGATFGAKDLTVDSDRFAPGALVGQRVVAGTSAGTVAANTANSVTLKENWIGGQPAADSAWVISGSSPHTGAVELGGALTGPAGDQKVGLRAANAQASYAMVKPRYTASITLVLDLRDDLGSPAANADRVLLRTDPATPLFAADFPITTAVDFHTTAGFLKVKLGGNLTVGPAAEGKRMIEVRFKQAQDLSLGTLFSRLEQDPAGLLAATSSVRTAGRVEVSVPGATGALGTGVGVDVSWTAGGQPSVDTSDLAGLFALDFDPNDPKAMFALVVEALRLVNVALSAPSTGTGPLDTEIPVLGRTARELLGSDESGVGADVSYTADGPNFLLKDTSRDADSGFAPSLADWAVVIGSKAYRVLARVDTQTLRVDAAGTPTPADGTAYALRPELADAVDRLLAAPPDTLQDAIDVLNGALGQGSGIAFTLDERAGGPYLRLGLDWKRGFHTGGPLTFGWDGARELVSLDSSGAFTVDVDARAQLGLLLPLRADGVPLLDRTSSANVTVTGAATDLAVAARVGPLALDLGKAGDPGTVRANLSFGLGGLPADGPIAGLLGVTPSVTTAGTDCGDGVGGPNVPICARAPLFVNDCDPGGTSNLLSLELGLDLAANTATPDLDTCFANLALRLTDFNVGIDGYLAKVEEALRLASFDGKLPLVGDDLQQGQRFIADLRTRVKDAIGPVLADATLDNAGAKAALDAALAEVAPGATSTVTCRADAATCGPEDFQSVRITLTAARGDPSAEQGCAGDGCLGVDVPLDLGVPGLSLKAEKGATDGIKARLGWKLRLDLVLDRDEGFYVATHSGDAAPELEIGASFDMPGDLAAQLAFIRVNAQKQGTDPLVGAYFAIDLKGSVGEQSCFGDTPAGDCAADPTAKLTLAEFGDLGSLLATDLTAKVKIDWKLAAKVDPGGEAASALPGISARFGLSWQLTHQRGALSAAGDSPEHGLRITFTDIALDAGAFFDKILKPVVEQLKAVTGPLQPVIDTLYAPIPVLSDLSKATGGPDITLVWLAKQFSTLSGGPDLSFVDTVRAVVTFINRIPDCDAGCSIPLGQFLVDGDQALTTEASPASAESLIDRADAFTRAKSADEVKAAVDTAAGDDGEKIFTPGGDGKSTAAKIGFTFPVFDNPGSLFGLLMGQDVELIGFDSGPLTLGFSWRQSFGPVYAPPPVLITLAGSASVTARFIAGLDTAGIRHAIEAAGDGTAVNAVKLLDGLYFKTADSTGTAVPVVTLRGEIAAGAQVSVLFLKAGIEGGIRLTIGFSWNDPNNDGKFRTSEFLQALLVNPICLFTTSGQLSVFLKVYITIDLVLFSKTFDFTLVDAVLLDFRAQPDCTPPPPELGGTVDDTLVVFAGRFGKQAQRGDAAWDNGAGTYAGDVIKVYALHYADAGQEGASDDFDGFAVEALGRRQEFLDPALTRVVVDGRGYQVADAAKTSMSILLLGDGDTSGDGTKTSAFDRTAVVIGSDGRDQIRTGTGPAYVDGRGGDDVIVTAEAAGVVSRVAGGAGADTVTTGDGNSVVAGDSGLGGTDRAPTGVHTSVGDKTLTGLIDWTTLADPTASTGGTVDHVTVGHGTNTVYGNGGDDVLGVVSDDRPSGNNLLVGGPGGDTVNGGRGDDTIHTFDTTVPAGVDDPGTGDAGLTNQVDTGSGQDTVYGSAGTDLVVSHSANGQTGRLYGYGGDDVLVGGHGTDELFGGPGDDHVLAEPSRVGPAGGDDGYGRFREVVHEPLPAGVQSQTKLLVGGPGRDHLIGGDGGSTVFGDRHLPAETCADATLADGQPAPADQGDRDLILGGAGVERVAAGGGADRADLGGGDDRACGQLGDDTLHLGAGADRAWGAAGVDQLHGDGDDDLLFGNAGDDGLHGGDGVDTVEGNAGDDQVFGGPDGDVLHGGGRTAGAADGRDHLYGEGGADRIVGDNGTVRVGDIGPLPLDLAGDVPGAGAGDVISGGADGDLAYGGLGADRVDGDAGDDRLEGNNDADVVHGNAGQDEIVGGSAQEPVPGTGRPDSGDQLFGDADSDLIAGDNARFAPAGADATRVTQGRSGPARKVTLLDLGFTPAAGTSGGDLISGGDAGDVIFGQGGPDRVHADGGADFAEGGPGSDWVEGNHGDDDLVGGSSTAYDGAGTATTGQPDAADALFGGPDSDAVIGDNGAVLRPLPGETPTAVTVRLGGDGAPFGPRIVVLLDRAAVQADRHGGDRISGGDGVDTLWGQDGDDALTGDGGGDYLEGNGGTDVLRGDSALDAAGRSTVTPLADPGWPGAPAAPAQLIGAGQPAGQDDLIGGSSAAAFRDAGDVLEGNGAADVLLGDNGSLLRTVTTVNGQPAERVYTERYPTGAVPADATVARTHDPALPGPSTRFCTTAQATCEPAGAYGADQLFGDAGDDGVWGQDGDDLVRGGDGDDDLFGELGADTLYGESGRDAILGDRGGVVNQYLNADDVAALGFTVTLSSVPQETFTGFRAGDYDRRVDLLHDTDGDAWIGSPTSAPMPHSGLTAGGDDRIRGGAGADNIHAGFGDDIANGDSGGDQLFGSEGSDVLWGGRGCDPVLDAAEPQCLVNGVFSAAARGDHDQYVDHLFGGAGATSGPAVAAVLSSDLLDFRPRGSYPDNCAAGAWPVDTADGTIDPCRWFELTGLENGEPADNQHHHGTDWIYGGWDRDVLQGDVTANGPNNGDRLFDWNGAYNLYTHCNAAYGGFNDIRQHSPAMQDFLTRLAWATGAGRTPADVTTPGTSAFLELSYVYPRDNKEQGAGAAFPGTPGHFDQPSCTD